MVSRSRLGVGPEIQAKADAMHDKYVQRTYGLAPREYARMLEAQDGRCAICTKRPRNRRLAVDHDHLTGLPRGLLCFYCNRLLLGFIEHNPIAVYNASVYLMKIYSDFGDDWGKISPVSPGKRMIEIDDGMPF